MNIYSVFSNAGPWLCTFPVLLPGDRLLIHLKTQLSFLVIARKFNSGDDQAMLGTQLAFKNSNSLKYAYPSAAFLKLQIKDCHLASDFSTLEVFDPEKKHGANKV